MQGARVAVEALSSALEAMEHDCQIAAKQFRASAASCEAFTHVLLASEQSRAPSVRKTVLLASASKARRAIVASVLPDGVDLADEFISPDIDERAIRRDDPEAMVLAIAHAKADRAVELLSARTGGARMPDLIICADQVVLFGSEVREKPVDKAQAKTHLMSYGLQGKPAVCVTAVVVVCGTLRLDGVDRAEQHFTAMPEQVCEALVAKGDVMQSAGSFVVEDPDVAPYLGERRGELSSIRGLPGKLTRRLLVEAMEALDDQRKRQKKVA